MQFDCGFVVIYIVGLVSESTWRCGIEVEGFLGLWVSVWTIASVIRMKS